MRHAVRSLLIPAPAAIGLGLLASASPAQLLEVAPISIDLPPGRLTTTLQITNRGVVPTTMQVRSFAWSQTKGADQLDATADLLVSPPFATVAAGESQTVRLVLRRPAGAAEATYRLLVDQLPPAAAPGSVRVALRLSLPVFAAPTGPSNAALSWILRDTTNGERILIIKNDGTRRARIFHLKLSSRSSEVTAPGFSFRYVLAGHEIAVPLQFSAHSPPPTAIHITAGSDQGGIEADAFTAPAR